MTGTLGKDKKCRRILFPRSVCLFSCLRQDHVVAQKRDEGRDTAKIYLKSVGIDNDWYNTVNVEWCGGGNDVTPQVSISNYQNFRRICWQVKDCGECDMYLVW